ncbi:DNA ligase-like domain-containing protein [Streptomyces erythrochromogenes]|uniref:hypothetical protein n=1 Tax=Streptomyces erythrochromogenes TaxID=285574 RepID=UPI0037016D20
MALRPPKLCPGPAALRAGVAYEQELDGHRALVFTTAGPVGTVVVQTRRGALVLDRWRDLVAAAEELVVWDTEEGRLSFEALQRRAAARARGARPLATRWLAYFVAFDVLQHDGQELLLHVRASVCEFRACERRIPQNGCYLIHWSGRVRRWRSVPGGAPERKKWSCGFRCGWV